MISATDIHERIASGLSVRLERAGRVWTLPVETSHRQGEFTFWALHDVVWPGDRLVFPAAGRQLVLGMVVDGIDTGDGRSFFAVSNPGWMRLRLVVLTFDDCPACDTLADHHIDIPTDLSEVNLYAVRTCITCDHSWRQEVLQ